MVAPVARGVGLRKRKTIYHPSNKIEGLFARKAGRERRQGRATDVQPRHLADLIVVVGHALWVQHGWVPAPRATTSVILQQRLFGN
eukprot:SAG11_NODE_9300_length_924_cov_1.798788_2_plen_85_part_01